MGNIFHVNTASIDTLFISSSITALPQSIINFGNATSVSGTFFGDGRNLTNITASYIIGSNTSASFASSSISSSYTILALNVINGSVSASYAETSLSASYAPGSPSVSSSYALSASYALNGGGGGMVLTTGSLYPITSSWSEKSLNTFFSSQSFLNVSSSYASSSITSSYSLQSSTASYISGSLSFVGKTDNYFPLWISNTLSDTSSLYQSQSRIGINTISPQTTLHVVGHISSSAITSSLFGSASYSLSASYAPVGSVIENGGSYNISSSWASSSISSISSSYFTGSKMIIRELTSSYLSFPSGSGAWRQYIDFSTGNLIFIYS